MFAAPEGQRLDTTERRAAIEDAIARLQSDEFAPTADKAGIESVGDPFSDDTFSDDGRIAYTEAQFNETIETEDREEVVAVEDAVRETVEPAGVEVEFNGDEFPPIEQGTQELLGLFAALIVLMIVFRTFVATMILIGLALAAVGTAFLLLFILAGLTDINTITPLLVSMIGLGVGIDYSLFIVTRFRQFLHEGLSPADAATEAGASAGRAVLFAGTTVAISVTGLAFFGLDFVTKLGIGSALGVLTTVLTRELLADCGAPAARPQDRPAEGAVPAPDRRFRSRQGEDPDRPLGPVRDRARASAVFAVVLLVLLALAATSPSSAWAPPTRARSRRSRRPAAPTTCWPKAGPGFNGPIPIVVDVNDDPEAPQGSTRAQAWKASRPRASRSSTTRRRWRSSS